MKNPDQGVSGKRCSTVKTRKAKDKLRQRKEKREETRRKGKIKQKENNNKNGPNVVKSEKP